jgi:threonine/homoserine/homoserine lactone efflux protein
MIDAFIGGILLGLSVAITPGQALFNLLQTSIHKGLKMGVYVAVGIFISDVIFVALSALSYLGILSVLNSPKSELIIGIIGGAILILFGVFTFRKKPEVMVDNNNNNDEGVQKIKRKPLKYIAKGFILNMANPFLLFFWMSAMSAVSSAYGIPSWKVVIFFGSTLIIIFCTDFLKCFIAGKIKNYLKPRIITIINYILGLTLMIMGVVMIIRVSLKGPDKDKIEQIDKNIPLPKSSQNSSLF